MDTIKKVSKYFFYLISVCYATDGIVEVLVGSAWPVIARSIKTDISFIGILVMVNYFGSIITSINTYKIRQKIGTNLTMVLSMSCFVVSLIIYIIATNIFLLIIGVLITGVGVGLIEVGSSSYVLKAYDTKEESFLSAFWALGSVIGSMVMAFSIKYQPPYQNGFIKIIAILLINIILLLHAKLSWTKQKKSLPKEVVDKHSVTEEEKKVVVRIGDLIKNKNVLYVMFSFFLLEGVIVTMSSLVSTILVNQGMFSENMAVALTIVYFVAIFIGRIVFGHFSNKIRIINLLKTNVILAILLFVLISINIFTSILLFILIVAIGFVTSSLIPYIVSFLKERFDVTHLSAMIGYGDASGLCGIIAISGLTTIIMKFFAINYVELFFAVMFLLLYFLFVKLDSN